MEGKMKENGRRKLMEKGVEIMPLDGW